MRHVITVCLVCTCMLVMAFRSEASPGWEILRSQALSASQRASYQETEQLLRSALTSLSDPAEAAAVTLWNELGEAQEAQRRLAEAEQDYHRAIDINGRLKQPDNFGMAASLNDLASIFHARAQFASAETLLRQSYSLLEKNPAHGNLIAGSVLSNLGLNVQQQGRYEAARQLYERARRVIRESKGEKAGNSQSFSPTARFEL
jgi:tetratricopeptide (TPR) repeat protein